MADPTQSVAEQDEQDFSIPGESEDNTGDFSALGAGQQQPSVTAKTSPTAAPSASAAPSGVQVDTSQKVHPHLAILAGLAQRLISSVTGAQGNPQNAFDRGFQQASPQAQQMQQAQVSKAQSEADLEKMQVSLTGMKALQYEYMLKRLPQQLQEQHLQAVSAFKQALIKEGASIEAEGDDEKASDAQAMHLNGSDVRATGHAGRFYSLPTLDADGKAKFDVVYVPNKDVLQNDFKWTDADGQEHTISAGTPFSGALGKFVEEQGKSAANQTKSEHQAMANALKPNIPENELDTTANWLESQKKQNTPLYQQNKGAVDAQIESLRKSSSDIQAKRERTAAAGIQRKDQAKKAGNYYHWVGPDGETKVGKGSEVPEDAEPTPIGGEKEFAVYQNEAHMSNIVQQSLNRIHQDIDQHPELFDNTNARNILATTLEQIDRTHAAMLVAGTGGSIPLPSGLGSMINTALQNKALDPTTADAVKQYVADYKAMKDKALVMQMEMQGGKIGRGTAQAFKSITDQIPDGSTSDSRTAHRSMNDLQETQDELSKKYGNFGDFKKIAPYKPADVGASSTSAARIKQFEESGKSTKDRGLMEQIFPSVKNTRQALKEIGEKELELVGKKKKDQE